MKIPLGSTQKSWVTDGCVHAKKRGATVILVAQLVKDCQNGTYGYKDGRWVEPAQKDIEGAVSLGYSMDLAVCLYRIESGSVDKLILSPLKVYYNLILSVLNFEQIRFGPAQPRLSVTRIRTCHYICDTGVTISGAAREVSERTIESRDPRVLKLLDENSGSAQPVVSKSGLEIKKLLIRNSHKNF